MGEDKVLNSESRSRSAALQWLGGDLREEELDDEKDDDVHVALTTEKHQQTRPRTWAVDDTWDVSRYEVEVKEPALTFPFELDTFQKRAVYRVHCGENVFVAAHTSAGKTVVAEYAIARAFQSGHRAIYTSPIKALSNQKFREFSHRFEGIGSVGIVTGDVAVNPDASCVIMTTEILRTMLYNGDEGLDKVRWVIFDEVHYVNDRDRGVVWEEVIILLPSTISLVMLSATVPNYQEFAHWVGRTRQRPVYTVKTEYRPTPLCHYLHFRDETMLLQDSEKLYLESFKRCDELQKARFKPPPRPVRLVTIVFPSRPFGMTPAKATEGTVSGYVVEKVNHNDPSKPAARLGVKPGWIITRVGDTEVRDRPLEEVQQLTKEAPLPLTLEFEVPPKDGKEKDQSADKKHEPQRKILTLDMRERAETQRLQGLLRKLEADGMLPATIFVFSRRRVEAIARDIPHIDVNSADDKSKVHIFLKTSFDRLSEADKALPQVVSTCDLASRGVGIHHGGLLPVVKEAVEILFARGLVKILFATETFAMGVNMPARSVVFSSWWKHDGSQHRPLLPGEYTQMAGRAGRRGLDEKGGVYLLCGDDPPDQREINRMLTHKPARLDSRFRVTFAMILQLRRVSGVTTHYSVEDVMGRSFLENARAQRRPEVRRNLARKCDELEALPVLLCSCGEAECMESMVRYAASEVEARDLGIKLYERLYQSNMHRAQVFCSGRLLRVSLDGVIVLEDGALLGFSSARVMRVAVMMPCDEGRASEKALRECTDASVFRVRILDVPLEGLTLIYEQCIDAELCDELAAASSNGCSSNTSVDSHIHASSSSIDVDNCLSSRLVEAICSSSLEPLQVAKLLKLADLDFYDDALRQRRLQVLQDESRCHRCPFKESNFIHVQQRMELTADIGELERELGHESLGLLPELKAKEQVLRDLGFLGSGGHLQTKGHAATQVLCGDEITILEVVSHGLLDGCTAEEVASGISAFVVEGQIDEALDTPLPAGLNQLRSALLQCHRRVEEAVWRRHVEMDPEDFSRLCNVGLMSIVYRWACGESLSEIIADTALQEGTIVRAIVRTEELLQKLQDTARILGKFSLQGIFKDAAELVRRDIAFAQSLYIVD